MPELINSLLAPALAMPAKHSSKPTIVPNNPNKGNAPMSMPVKAKLLLVTESLNDSPFCGAILSKHARY